MALPAILIGKRSSSMFNVYTVIYKKISISECQSKGYMSGSALKGTLFRIQVYERANRRIFMAVKKSRKFPGSVI